MKIIISLFFSCLFFHFTSAQNLARRTIEDNDIKVKKFLIQDYKDYSEYGEMLDGKKHGLWQTIGIDSTVYISGTYNSDIQTGAWIIAYPDGSPRYMVTYDSLGWPVEFSRFYYNLKQVSINRKEGFSDDVFRSILQYEAMIFDKELAQYETNSVQHEDQFSRGYYSQYYDVDVKKLCAFFDEFLMQTQEEYKVTEYTHPGELAKRECWVGNGICSAKIVYEYKGEKIRKIDYYELDQLVKTETYDKDGKISKVKKF